MCHTHACVEMIECRNNSHTSLLSLFASHEFIIFLSQLSPSASLLSVTQDSFPEIGPSRGEMMTVSVSEMYFYYRSRNVLRICKYIKCAYVPNHKCVFTKCSLKYRHLSSVFICFLLAHICTHMQCGRVPCGFLWFQQSSMPHTGTSNLQDQTTLPPAAELFLYWPLLLLDLKKNTRPKPRLSH